MNLERLTQDMEDAMLLVYEARRNKLRLEDELHQAESSLDLKQRNADRIIATWLRAREDANAEQE